jgi:Protein of unknown function (DUF2490)
MIRIIKVILLLIWAQQSCAQYKDAGLWAEGTLAVECGKRWQFSAVPELRLDENMTRVARGFVDLGAQYKVNGNVSATSVVRSGVAENDGLYEWRNRIQLGLGFRFKWNDWTLNYAPRWQASLTPSAGFDADISTNMRNRFQLKYGGIKDWDFATGYEFFHSTGQYDFGTWQNWRWTTQIAHEISKRKSISAGYLVQRKLVGSPQAMDFVVLLGYKYTIKIKKEKNDQLTPSE